jgi:hypothetical protein
MYTASRQEPYMFISPSNILDILFLSEVAYCTKAAISAVLSTMS